MYATDSALELREEAEGTAPELESVRRTGSRGSFLPLTRTRVSTVHLNQ
jgi:hypothetical protein